jgi:hypothetical protein
MSTSPTHGAREERRHFGGFGAGRIRFGSARGASTPSLDGKRGASAGS